MTTPIFLQNKAITVAHFPSALGSWLSDLHLFQLMFSWPTAALLQPRPGRSSPGDPAREYQQMFFTGSFQETIPRDDTGEVYNGLL